VPREKGTELFKYKYGLHDFVRLEPGEECSLKKHFRRGPLKEVIGFYEAADRRYKDPERFISSTSRRW